MELHVIKKADDRSLGAKVLRISIGSVEGSPDQAYITYRGNLNEVQQLLQDVDRTFAGLTEEPPISPDDGKKYA